MSQDGGTWKNSIRVASRTDVGLRRANNQDSHAIVLASDIHHFLKRGHLFVVADGMGAHAAGELASQIATETIAQSYARRSQENISDALQNAVYDAHQQIRLQSEQEEALRDMGTTADALVLSPQGAVIAHVGDSRVYRLRNRVFEQLTFDHSLVWEIRASGRLAQDKIPSYIPKNVITRSLGPSDNLNVDLEGPFPVIPGDYFLLCSDGLSGQLDDTEIGQILFANPPEFATETLINLTNLRGGPDNITAVTAQVVAPLDTLINNASENREKPISAKTFSMLAYICLFFALLGMLLSGYSLMTNFDSFLPTLISAIITLLFGGGFFLLSSHMDTGDNEEYHDFSTMTLGKGPYVRVDATPGLVFVNKLATTVHQLRDAAQGDQWVIRWAEIDHHEQLASAAANQEEFTKAIYEYSQTINLIMRELKRQKRK